MPFAGVPYSANAIWVIWVSAPSASANIPADVQVGAGGQRTIDSGALHWLVAKSRIDQNDRCDRIDQINGEVMAELAKDGSLQDETYFPREDTAEIIDFLSALRVRGRDTADPRPRLTGPDGQSVELPEPMFKVLLQVAAAMKAGLAVTVAPHHLTLSTQEAADLLRISRTTLVRLLETGVIPFDKPSRHRKVRLDDLIQYRRRQRSQAEMAFEDM